MIDVLMGAVTAVAVAAWFLVALAGSRQAWRDLDNDKEGNE